MILFVAPAFKGGPSTSGYTVDWPINLNVSTVQGDVVICRLGGCGKESRVRVNFGLVVGGVWTADRWEDGTIGTRRGWVPAGGVWLYGGWFTESDDRMQAVAVLAAGSLLAFLVKATSSGTPKRPQPWES